ncbi:hypothetical protein K2Z83_15670 [Oscillochloris sp. ZM17-4]|uniref:hypothetical protein n=1 Tax=Oscillochloris sp. ZM17-4 TaxID=2866714 RepID=UPI001C73CBAA|nr:hypothetical protein [Oscillochloris sp. ZM17-4]MBX0329116.1 hypothetical protein [Oscillochloris sp. ZM17-4]
MQTITNPILDVADEVEAAASISQTWHYAMECGAGPDMLTDVAAYLRQIGTPEAMQCVRDIEASRLALVELQLTRWMNAGITFHCINADVTRLAVEHALPADLNEAAAQEALDQLSEAERLPYWMYR